MANKAKEKDNKNLIINTCIILIVIVAIIATAIVMLIIKGNTPSEEFFVSDGTKYVINLKGEESSSEEDDDYQAQEVHIVYYYSGEDITGIKTYYEYSTEAKAMAAFNYYTEVLSEDYDNIEINDKYVILTSNESDYKNKTTYDVEQQIKFIESQNEPTTDDIPVEEETIVEESIVEEPAEETTAE